MPNETISTQSNIFAVEESCPFLQSENDCCGATFSCHDRPILPQNLYCCSEDFDRCPLFLAKLLRDTHSQRADKLSESRSLW